MCGIAGYCGDGVAPQDGAALLWRMGRELAHRGPDGQGSHVGRGIGLGHRRLAVIDLSEGAAQPMASACGAIHIAYNGEVFNYLELRAELVARGRRFRSESDTEVVLQLYEEFGPDFVTKLNGDFALAIWDGRSRRLLLARDRVGVRPLFYHWQGGTLYFASEIKALMQVPGFSAEIDPLALDQIFTLWTPLAPRTAFKNVNELPPAHMMIVEGGHAVTRPYWALDFPALGDDPPSRAEGDVAEELS
ncbi:MAG: asparagine synthetase B, partial [Nitratireductor sp.]